jgi:AcrR family transcriptional regulator
MGKERRMTKKMSKDNRIEAIIQAAVDEFLENGYDGTSMEAVARRAGISKGGLYHHFSSKDEILLLANQKLNDPVAKIMLEAAQKPSAVDGLSSYIQNYLEYWEDHRREMVFYILSFAKLIDNPFLWKMYENYTEKSLSFFQDLYQRGIDSGDFIPHSAYESALTFMSALDGVVIYLMMDKDLKLGKVISTFQERFVRKFQKKTAKSQRSKGGGDANK